MFLSVACKINTIVLFLSVFFPQLFPQTTNRHLFALFLTPIPLTLTFTELYDLQDSISDLKKAWEKKKKTIISIYNKIFY